MIDQALLFLVRTVGDLFTVALLLRVLMQAFRVPFRNPFAQFVVAFTDFAVRPMRRVVPGFWGLDWASLVLAFLVQFGVVWVRLWLSDFPFALAGGSVWGVMLGLAGVRLVTLAVYLVIGVTLVAAVLSWVNPHTPLMPVVHALSEPFLRPIRRFVPLVGGVDLSPIVLFIVCQLVLMVPVLALEHRLLAAL